jgi:hypothetical protein
MIAPPSRANGVVPMRGTLAGMIVALVLIAFSGCQQKPAASLAAEEPGRPASAMGLAAPGSSASSSANEPRDTLAYEHTISVDLDQDTVAERLREIEAACNADSASRCTVLESSLHWRQRMPSASIRMRLAPSGVDGLITLASKGGKVVERNTHAEDLAQPVADTERELALLGVHRDRLADIMKSKNLGIDQLITVSKELATVQAQIETLSSAHANLIRRIDTDLLTIDLSPPAADIFSQTTPVRDALRASGATFREALADVIWFFSVFVPWLFVILPGVVLLRVFWRWVGRWLGRFERRAA